MRIFGFKKAAIILPIFLGMCLSLSAIANSQKIASIKVQIDNSVSRLATEKSVKEFLPIKEGDIFDYQKLDESLNHLRKWGLFDKINVQTTPTPEGIDILFHLNEATLIGEIDVTGNYPYVERKILKYLTVRAGDFYTPERIEEQIKRVEDFYDREGFFNTKVTIDQSWSEDKKDVGLTVKIKRGTILRYSDIEINGMDSIPEGRLVSAINPLRHFKQGRLNDAIRTVTEYYHLHGFPKARIKLAKKEIDYEKHRVSVVIDVYEGPKVISKFVGNKKAPSSDLRKVLTIYREGVVDDFELEMSSDEIKKFYKINGYPDASVSFNKENLKNGNILVTFKINEGRREKVEKIKFTGNDNISASRLRSEMRTKGVSLFDRGIFNQDVLNRDLKTLKNSYDNEGYVDSSIGEPKISDNRGRLLITIPIQEEEQSIVSDIVFDGGIDAFPKKSVIKTMKNKIGRPIKGDLLEEDRINVLSYYMDHGYPYAEVKYDIEDDGEKNGQKQKKIVYTIDPGKPAKIGQILVIGNSLTKTKTIIKALDVKEGQAYSNQKIINSQISLRRLGAFNFVNLETIGLAEKEEVINIRVKVEEQKPFVLDFNVSYSSDALLGGSMSFTNLNSFGLGKKTNLNLTGGMTLSRAELNWLDPRFAGLDLEMISSGWLEYQDRDVYTYAQAGGGFGFTRRFHRTSVAIRYDVERNYFVNGDSTAADTDALRDSTFSKVELSGSFDTRNSFAYPTKGIYTQATTSFFNEIKGVGSNFVKLGFVFGGYIPILKPFSMSHSVRFDTIETFGKNISVPGNELYLMGGDNTIRGFSRNSLGPVNSNGNPTGGRLRWIYNAELHISMKEVFQWAFFYDMGALVNTFSQINWDTTKESAGFGLRYITPVGPIRADYGIVIHRQPGENFGRFHLTFGYVF